MSGCPKCEWHRAELRVTAMGIDVDAVVEDGLYLIDPGTIENPAAVDVEAVCSRCGYIRYLDTTEWRWA